MAQQDIASYNAKFFNYMVCSQETEPGEGWDYDNWLDDLYANPAISTPTLGKEIVDTYVQKCGDNYNAYSESYLEYYNYLIESGYSDDDYISEYQCYVSDFKEQGEDYKNYNDSTLSVLDLTKMSAYISAWEDMTTKLAITSSSKFNTLKNRVTNNCTNYSDYDVYDAKDFINLVKTSYSIDNTALLAAFNNLVIYSKVGSNNKGNGLCFSLTGGDNSSILTNNLFPTWWKMVKSYGSSGGSWY